MKYGAVRKSNLVILRLRKEKSTAGFENCNDPHAANSLIIQSGRE